MESASARSGVERLQQFQRIAPLVAIVIAWFQWVMLVLIAPILTGPAISDEKRNRTLAVLACTPLTAAQIVMNALSSRLLQLLILGLIATPLLLAVRLFGGLSAEQILATTCVGLASAILSASLGIFASVTARRTATAVARGIGAFAGICALPFIIMLVWYLVLNQGAMGRGPPAGLRYLTLFSPFFLMIGLSFPGSPFPVGVDTWVTHCIGSLTASALLCTYSSVVLRRVMQREAVSDGIAPAAKTSSRRSRRKKTPARPGDETAVVETILAESRAANDASFLWRTFRSTFIRILFFLMVAVCLVLAFYFRGLHDGAINSVTLVIASIIFLGLGLLSFIGARRSGRKKSPASREPAQPGEEPVVVETILAASRTVSDSPVLWRELRQRAFRSALVRWLFFVMVAACLGFAYYHGGLTDTVMDSVMLTIACVLVIAIGCLSATGAVGNEMQSRTWHILLTTPLSPRQILWGKLVGSIRRQWPIPAVLGAHLLISVNFGKGDPAVPIFGLPVICISMIVVSSLGLLASVLFRKTTRAMVATIAAVTSALLNIPVTFAILGGILRGGVLSGVGQSFTHIAEVLAVPNPVVLCTVIAQSSDRLGRMHGYLLPIGGATLSTPKFAVLLIALGMAALLLCYGFFRLAVARFERARNDQTGS